MGPWLGGGGICNFRSMGRGEGLMPPDLGEGSPGAQRSLGPRDDYRCLLWTSHICAALPRGRAMSEDTATVLVAKGQAHSGHPKESRGLLALISETPHGPGLQEVTASPGHGSRKTQGQPGEPQPPVPLRVTQATLLLPRGPWPTQRPSGIHTLVSGHTLSRKCAVYSPHQALCVDHGRCGKNFPGISRRGHSHSPN